MKLTRRGFNRISVRGLAILAGSTALAACSGAPPAAPAAPTQAATSEAAPSAKPTAAPPAEAKPTVAPATSKPATAEPVKIVHWQHHSESRKTTVDSFIKAFKEENPGTDFQFESIPWGDYFDKLYAALAANSGPNTFQIPMGLTQEFIDGGQISALDRAFIQGNPQEEFLSWVIQRLQDKGKLYGLPLDVQTLVLYVNDALAQGAGLDLTKAPKDWVELETWMKALTKKSATTTDQIGCDLSYYSAECELTFQQQLQPTPMVDPASLTVNWGQAPVLEAFTYVTKLVKDYDDPAFLKGQQRFALGKAGMLFGHPVTRGSLAQQAPDLKYTIIPFPSPAGKPYLTGGSHWAWVVSQEFKNQERAWQWVSFVTSEKAQQTWYEVAGDLPSRKKFSDDPAFRKTPNDNVVMDSLKAASPWCWIGWAEWVKLYGDAVERVILANADPQKSLQQAADDANATIKKHTPRS